MQTQTATPNHISPDSLELPKVSKAPTVMTVTGAADYLGLAVSTLNKWRCHGGGPAFVKMGRAVRYRVVDLDAYVEDSVRGG